MNGNKIRYTNYSPENGIQTIWERGFEIKTSIENDNIIIEGNKEGLISLARHLLTLAQESVPSSAHIHLDENNSLEDGSIEMIIVKTK